MKRELSAHWKGNAKRLYTFMIIRQPNSLPTPTQHRACVTRIRRIQHATQLSRTRRRRHWTRSLHPHHQQSTHQIHLHLKLTSTLVLVLGLLSSFPANFSFFFPGLLDRLLIKFRIVEPPDVGDVGAGDWSRFCGADAEVESRTVVAAPADTTNNISSARNVEQLARTHIPLRPSKKPCPPLASSSRKNAVTAVHPLCVLSSCAILLNWPSTAWNVLLRTSGICVPAGTVWSVSSRCYDRVR